MRSCGIGSVSGALNVCMHAWHLFLLTPVAHTPSSLPRFLSTPLVEQLLSAGADPKIKNSANEKPEDLLLGPARETEFGQSLRQMLREAEAQQTFAAKGDVVDGEYEMGWMRDAEPPSFGKDAQTLLMAAYSIAQFFSLSLLSPSTAYSTEDEESSGGEPSDDE